MSLLGHQLAKSLARQHGAEDVQVKDPAERVRREIEKLEIGTCGRGGLVAAGAVDEAVDFAVLSNDVFAAFVMLSRLRTSHLCSETCLPCSPSSSTIGLAGSMLRSRSRPARHSRQARAPSRCLELLRRL